MKTIINNQDGESKTGDFGARHYDELSGRFLSVDPLWASFPDQTPYQYGYNNPLLFKDPSGLSPEGKNPCPGLPCEGYNNGVMDNKDSDGQQTQTVSAVVPSGAGTGENPVGAPASSWTIEERVQHVQDFNTTWGEDLARTRQSLGNDMPGGGELFTGRGTGGNGGGNGIPNYGPNIAAGNGNAKVDNPSNVKTLLKVAERHLSVAINNTNKDGYEWGGYLVGNQQMTWVRWADFHTDELTSGFFSGISIQEHGIGVPNFSYGEVVLARVHTHPSSSTFSYKDISTFAFTGILTPNEQHNGFFSIVVTNNNYFVLEMVNSEAAVSIYQSLGGEDGIKKYYNSIRSNSKGDHWEKVRNAVLETIKLFDGAILYHEFRR